MQPRSLPSWLGLAGDVCVAVMSLQVSAPLWGGEVTPHLLHPVPTRPRSASASSPPPGSWGSRWPEVAPQAVGMTVSPGCQEPDGSQNPYLRFSPYGTPLPLSTRRNSRCVKRLMINRRPRKLGLQTG